VKKGIVAVLLVLAIVVLVSPGIIGRLAEQSVEESFDRAANDSGEFIVTSSGFDRGWLRPPASIASRSAKATCTTCCSAHSTT